MEFNRIAIDPILLTYVAQTLGKVPENLYDFQKIKNLACGGKPIYQKVIDPLHDPVPERLEIVKGDFSVIGKMSRLKKLTISAMQVNDFSFLKSCVALESLKRRIRNGYFGGFWQSEAVWPRMYLVISRKRNMCGKAMRMLFCRSGT